MLGLGNIGPAAAMPVMEGKAAAVQAVRECRRLAPSCLPPRTPILSSKSSTASPLGTVASISKTSPRQGLEVERRLRELLDVPVFHDDPHGTAIVVLAALTTRCSWCKGHLGMSGWWFPESALPGGPSSSCYTAMACSIPELMRSPMNASLPPRPRIADCVDTDELNADYIVPSVFDLAVAPAVAAAVRKATS